MTILGVFWQLSARLEQASLRLVSAVAPYIHKPIGGGGGRGVWGAGGGGEKLVSEENYWYHSYAPPGGGRVSNGGGGGVGNWQGLVEEGEVGKVEGKHGFYYWFINSKSQWIVTLHSRLC